MSALPFRTTRESSLPAPSSSDDMKLGIEGFAYRDLFDPARLRDLYDVFCTDLLKRSPDTFAAYESYKDTSGRQA